MGAATAKAMATQPAMVQVRGARNQARIRLVSSLACAFAPSLTLNCQYRDA
jgi:hypothetical protein